MAKVALIGAGNMGEALIRGLLEAGFKEDEIIFSEVRDERRKYIKERYKISDTKDLAELTSIAQYIFLVVKPQDAEELLESLSPLVTEKNVIVSAMAGLKISTLSSILGEDAKVIRIMPNLSVAVKEGVIGICRNRNVNNGEFEFLKKTLQNLGLVIELKEELFDALTAYAGSGPAFFLFFLEGMVEAGVKMGFSKDSAFKMAEKIVSGTMKLMASENLHPSILREKITSPGGTTIWGLAILEEKAFKGAIIKAFEKAERRARKLSV